jgi:thiamine-phosphate pyrophosphorylase
MIIISNPQFIPNEIAVINALFEAGLEIFHLRKPEADVLEMSKFISQIDNRFHSRIMIHSHYELLNSFNLRGIHFTEKTKCLQDEFANVTCKKSRTVHELADLNLVKSFIDYVFLSPLFPSVSKVGYSKQWNFEEMKRDLYRKRNFEIVALGGITLDNMKQIRELGFNDFALLGSIWELVKAGCSTEQLIETYRRFNNEK